MPDQYNYLITALETIGEEKLTWEYVRDRLIHEADKKEKSKDISNSLEKSEHAPDALFTKRKAMDKKNCHYCKKPGHFARDCYKKKADSKWIQEIHENKRKTQKDQASSNFASNTSNKDKTPDVALKVGNNSSKNDWWIDSGASQHLTPNKGSLNNFERFNKPIEIKLADNSILYSYG